MRSRSDLAGRLGGDIALRRRSDIAKRNHLGREGGRGDVAATFVKVAATQLRPKFLTGLLQKCIRIPGLKFSKLQKFAGEFTKVVKGKWLVEGFDTISQ